MAKIIAITNQKGGVGKTTTAMNFGIGLRLRRKRVLLIDLDPQCSLTYIMGGRSDGITVQDLLLNPQTEAMAAVQRLKEGSLIASNRELGSLEMVLTQNDRAFRLSEALKQVSPYYDYIVIDSPPALGVLTVNILTAANGVIVPALADIFSLQGVGELYSTIQAVKEYCNPELLLYGILLVRVSGRRLLLDRSMREMLEETAAQIDTRVFASSIREMVAVREAEAERQSIFAYAPGSRQAEDYERFLDEFLELEHRGVWRQQRGE